jgi:hypothetical protein
MGVIAWFRNVLRAVLLDVDFYNEAEHDSSLNRQSFVVVVVATLMSGVGSALATETNVLVGGLVGAVTGVVGWLVWSWLALVVGTRVFDGTADYGEMVRVIGFAFAPLAIGVIPWLGFVGAAWSLVAATIGIREGMDFSTKRAIATVAVGWAAWLLLSVIVQWLIGVTLMPSWPF